MTINQVIKQRDSNFELLRIVAMFLIVTHHFCLHNGIFFGEQVLSRDEILSNGATANYFFLQLISVGGKIGVNIFVLISGYYLINSVPKI